MQTDRSRTYTPPFLRSYTLGHYSSAREQYTHNYSVPMPESDTSQLATAPVSQSPLKLFKLASLKPATLTCPFF